MEAPRRIYHPLQILRPLVLLTKLGRSDERHGLVDCTWVSIPLKRGADITLNGISLPEQLRESSLPADLIPEVQPHAYPALIWAGNERKVHTGATKWYIVPVSRTGGAGRCDNLASQQCVAKRGPPLKLKLAGLR